MPEKGFCKSQPVTDFVCETLGVRDLEDRKIQIDKEELKKAIYGNCYFCMHNFTRQIISSRLVQISRQVLRMKAFSRRPVLQLLQAQKSSRRSSSLVVIQCPAASRKQ